MIVFDLQKLQEHKVLMPIMFFLLQNVISSKLYDKALRKLIIFDEAWKYFNDAISAELIENLYRTARKFNAAVYSISQSPDDFLQSAASSSVLGNSYVKYILQLQKGHENLQKFGLNEQEIETVKSLSSVRKKYSEVFLKFNQCSRVLRIQPSAADYGICTTDPDDEQTQNRLLKENPGISQIDLLKKLKGEL
jgi:type IV secretory pathway VirB4 component